MAGRVNMKLCPICLAAPAPKGLTLFLCARESNVGLTKDAKAARHACTTLFGNERNLLSILGTLPTGNTSQSFEDLFTLVEGFSQICHFDTGIVSRAKKHIWEKPSTRVKRSSKL